MKADELIEELSREYGVPSELVEKVIRRVEGLLIDWAQRYAEDVASQQVARHALRSPEPTIGSKLWVLLHRN